MSRPLLTAAAKEASDGVEGVEWLVVLQVFAQLLPLLAACAGEDPAGWMRGDGAWFRKGAAARRREALVRLELLRRGVVGVAADRTVDMIKRTDRDTARRFYREAGYGELAT